MQKHHEYTTLPTRRDSRVRPALRPALDDLHSRQTRRRRHTRPGLERLEERSLLSLVAAYNFDAGSGSVLADVSGNGNNGTIANATWSTAGKFGKALSFNGTSALVTVNDSASLHLTTGMTLEAWVNPSKVSSAWRDVVYKGNDNYFLEGTSSNSGVPVGGGLVGSRPSHVESIGTAALPTNTWTFLAATYDGTTMRLYVNGSLTSTKTGAGGTLATSTNPLQIGGDSIYGQYFNGLIDNVRIYNTALTGSQIQTDMNTPVGNDTTPPTVTSKTPALGATGVAANTLSLVAAYNFDAGSGAVLADVSGNGNNGTITNATWTTSGKYGDALVFNGTSACGLPDSTSLHLTTGMTLEAWVNPSAVSSAWRDVIYKGNDNYWLEATRDTSGVPAAGARWARGSYVTSIGTAALTSNTWTFLTETYNGSTLRLYVNGTLVSSLAGTAEHRDLDRPVANRRRQHLRPVLHGNDRQRADLQHGVDPVSDPDGHEHRP